MEFGIAANSTGLSYTRVLVACCESFLIIGLQESFIELLLSRAGPLVALDVLRKVNSNSTSY